MVYRECSAMDTSTILLFLLPVFPSIPRKLNLDPSQSSSATIKNTMVNTVHPIKSKLLQNKMAWCMLILVLLFLINNYLRCTKEKICCGPK